MTILGRLSRGRKSVAAIHMLSYLAHAEIPEDTGPRLRVYAHEVKRVGQAGRDLVQDSLALGAPGQDARLVEYANAQGWSVGKAVTEVGSGMNGRRPKLMRLLSDPQVRVIVVEHRDRLMRFGFEYLETALAAQGRRLVVLDLGEVQDDLVQDMVEVLTFFCARLYGKRPARNRARKAMEVIECSG